MQKLLDVKATKLKRDDVIKVAGTKYRVGNASHHFSGTYPRVSVHLRSLDGACAHISLSVSPKTRFNIKRKK